MAENSLSYGFMGEYVYSLDAKGRMSLPQKLRKGISEQESKEFVITRGLDHCLLLYPIGT